MPPGRPGCGFEETTRFQLLGVFFGLVKKNFAFWWCLFGGFFGSKVFFASGNFFLTWGKVATKKRCAKLVTYRCRSA